MCMVTNILILSLYLLHPDATDEWQHFSMGYKEFMYELFDDNVLFLEGLFWHNKCCCQWFSFSGDAWHSMRKSLESLFDHESVAGCLEETKRLNFFQCLFFIPPSTTPAALSRNSFVTSLPSESEPIYTILLWRCNVNSEPVVVYKTFKLLATRLSIALFLSHHTSPEDSQVIAELMTLHWRGIISVPVNMRGPWSLWQSGYSTALSAKDRLKALIADIIKSRPSALVCQ